MKTYDMLRYDEGKKNSLYKDTLGFWTIGVGHLVTKDPSVAVARQILDKKFKRVTGGTLTDAEVESLFNEDIEVTIRGIMNSKFLAPIYTKLDCARQSALINMCFQMGVSGVEGFRNSMSYISAGQWDKAAANLKQSKWYKQTTNRANRVINVFQTGNFNSYK